MIVERMNTTIIFFCLIFATSLAIGQVLFKLSADHVVGHLERSLIYALASPWLLAAGCVYFFTAGLWVYILTRVPLTLAYPFSLLGSALVPILAYIVFGEQLSAKAIFGMLLVLVGLSIMYVL